MPTMKPAFEVDKKGLAKLLARRGKHFAVLELIQNALDEDVREVKVVLSPASKRGKWQLVVEDDSPTGFADLSHAYTLFAESSKKTDPEKRGRFNLGEKLVIALCDHATIVTTTGGVEFTDNGRRSLRRKTEAGSVFCGTMRMTLDEVDETIAAIESVIVPDGIKLTVARYRGTYNPGDPVDGEEAVQFDYHTKLSMFEETLPTERADEEGYLRATKRKTEVEVFEPREGEVGTLYEMGIPVVETGDTWHVNVLQKIPLNTDRDNVTPSYLKKVRTFVLNAMADELPKEAATAAWVSEALSSKDVESEAVGAVLDHRYGKKRVIADPSDPEGTKLAVSQGYTVIQAGSLNRDQWSQVRRTGRALPAGRVTPSPKPYSDSPDAEPEKVIPEEKWTDGMRRVAGLSRALGKKLMGAHVSVRFVADVRQPWAANYGPGRLCFNKGRLGTAWFNQDIVGGSGGVLRLLIHEFGHHYSMDHLSSEYHDALCKLGVKLTQLALDEPEFFEEWT